MYLFARDNLTYEAFGFNNYALKKIYFISIKNPFKNNKIHLGTYI